MCFGIVLRLPRVRLVFTDDIRAMDPQRHLLYIAEK